MPRPPRLDAPGVVHHVWARAVEGRPIFLDPEECDDLVRRLIELSAALGSRCFAWVLMSNHVHLVVRTGSGTLSAFVHRLHTGFASRFNARHGRQGHVFQSRFGSRVVRDDADLMGLVRYVHGNPLAAGLARNVDALAAYPWCGHAALVGRREPLPFEAVDETLSLFGANRKCAVANLRTWMARGRGEIDEIDGEDRLCALIRDTCAEQGAAEADLREGRRLAAVSRARTRICQRAVAELGMRPSELARRLGLSEGAVSQALRRVSKGGCQTPF